MLLFGIVGCSNNEIPSHLLIDNGGVFYEAGSKKPFDGTSIENQDGHLFKRTYFSKGQITKAEEFYKSGLIKRILIKNDNEFLATVFDEDGNDISNKHNIFFNSNGLIKQAGSYINGKKDGVWESYNKDGELNLREYWDIGTKLTILDINELYFENNILYQAENLSAKVPYTGMVRVFSDKTSYSTAQYSLIKVIDGKRANLYEVYLADSGKLINQSNCSFVGGNNDFNKEYLSYSDSSYLLEECESKLYYEDSPNKLRNKYTLYKSDNGTWNWEGIGFYKSGIPLFKSLRVVGNNEIDVNRIANFDGEETYRKYFYEDGTLHTDSNLVNNKIIIKRYNKDGIDISNGEAMGSEFNNFPYEEWSYMLLNGFYKNGLKDGMWEREDGVAGYTYKNDKRNGYYFDYLNDSYKEKNCLASSGYYVDDLLHGKKTTYVTYPYDRCGEIDEVKIFNMGEVDLEAQELLKKQLEAEIIDEEEASGMLDLYVARVNLLNFKDDAQAMVSKIEANGLPSFTEVSAEDKNLYAVYVGPFLDKSDIYDNLTLIHKVSGSIKIKILVWNL